MQLGFHTTKRVYCKGTGRKPTRGTPGGMTWGLTGQPCKRWTLVARGSEFDPAVIKAATLKRSITALEKRKANKPAPIPGKVWVWGKVGMKGLGWRSVPLATPAPTMVNVPAFIPTPTQRAPAVSIKPGAFAVKLTPKPIPIISTPIPPAPPMPQAPAPGFDIQKILPLAIGAGAALFMLRGS